MAVAVTTTPRFSPGAPRRLFQDRSFGGLPAPQYDVSADGRRFVLVEGLEGEEVRPPSIGVVQNWYEEFRNREQDYGMHP